MMRSLVLVLLVGCAGDGLELTVGNAGVSGEGVGTFVSLASRTGEPVDAADLAVTVSTRGAGGDWVPATDLVVEPNGHTELDVVLVADNSGSTTQWEGSITEAVEHFSHVVLAASHPDRVALVRVSTEATLVQDLTEDEATMAAAATTLFVANGWTALWDGVRLANEVLEAGSVEARGADACVDRAYRGVVVFTDGGDNNSSDEQDTSYAGDGIDTTFEDLLDLRVHDIPTAIHTVSVGDDAEVERLDTLAAETGGKARSIQTYGGLDGALNGAATQLQGQMPVCFVPADCAHTEALVTVTTGRGNQETTASYATPIPSTCD